MSDSVSVTGMRRSYVRGQLDEGDLAEHWVTQFTQWFDEAVTSGQLVEPNAMLLATASPDGRPSVRTVLLRSVDARGFVFYTNYRSRKGRELAANPAVSLAFPWVPLERQVIVTGTASRVDRAETEAYFRSRPRASQLAAWASEQSAVISGRQVLDDALAELERRWPEGVQIPVPEQWGGLRVAPDSVEFWQGRPARLHDRLRYRWTGGGPAGGAGEGDRAGDADRFGRAGARWVVERLAP